MNKKEKKYIISLMLFSFALFSIYTIIVPFNGAPDEKLRFDIVDFISRYRELPVGGDQRLYYGEYGVTYAFKPYIAYLFAAIICIITDFLKINISNFMVARFFSVICGVGTIYFTYLISAKIFKKYKIKYVIPLMLASIPQFAFINSYVNQDSFMIFLSSIIIYLWLIGIESNWSWNVVIKIGIANGLVLLTYMNGYIVILSTLIIVLFTYKNKDKIFIRKALACIGIMFIVSGWFFIRNLIIYNGEIFGSSIAISIKEELAIPELKPSLIDVPAVHGMNGFTMLLKTDWIKKTFISFWAMLGNMDIRVPSYYYLAMGVITLSAVIGVIFNILKSVKRRYITENDKLKITFFIMMILALIISVRYSTYNDYQPQGRYLYAAIIPIIMIGFDGINTVIEKLRYKNKICLIVVTIILFMNLTLPLIAMINKYYFVI